MKISQLYIFHSPSHLNFPIFSNWAKAKNSKLRGSQSKCTMDNLRNSNFRYFTSIQFSCDQCQFWETIVCQPWHKIGMVFPNVKWLRHRKTTCQYLKEENAMHSNCLTISRTILYSIVSLHIGSSFALTFHFVHSVAAIVYKVLFMHSVCVCEY